MPTLDNPGHEAFALACAGGASLIDASRPYAAPAHHQAFEYGQTINIFNSLTLTEKAMERPSPPSEAPAAAPSPPPQRPSVAPRAARGHPASAAIPPLTLPGQSHRIYGRLR